MMATSYIRYRLPDFDDEILCKDLSGKTLDQVLCAASKMYCFDDLDDVEVLDVVHENKPYYYCGWRPAMEYSFEDADGREVWTGYFPNWEH